LNPENTGLQRKMVKTLTSESGHGKIHVHTSYIMYVKRKPVHGVDAAVIPLVSDSLEVTVDPGRGADILSLTHRASGTDVLFRTPWRVHADRVRAGSAPALVADAQTVWMEHYRGGWQTLFPNAGPGRVHDGAPFGFHGEASTAAWDVVERTPTSVQLRTELFTVPVAIHRTIAVDGPTVRVDDELANLSAKAVTTDYCSHPAFGGAFLDGECVLEVAAEAFTEDPSVAGTGGGVVEWPGGRVPGPDAVHGMFGWFSGFREGSATITNPGLGLAVGIAWDAQILPYAWLWQEFHASPGFPWFGRARVMALEPSSTPTGGPARVPSLTIPAGGTVRVPVAVTLTSTQGVH
jgi:hypothetical protein